MAISLVSSRVKTPLDHARNPHMPYVPQNFLMYPISSEFSITDQRYLLIPKHSGNTIQADFKDYFEIVRWDGKQDMLDKYGSDGSVEITVDSRLLSVDEAVRKFIVEKAKLEGRTYNYDQIAHFVRASLGGFENNPEFFDIPREDREAMFVVWKMHVRI